MFDFHFGDKEKVLENPEEYIIFIKRMLPRWLNGIPDSECLAIWDALHQNTCSKPGVLVETGSGASTICLALYAVLHETKAFSWDINGSRGAELRGILNDTIGRSFRVSLWDHWTFVSAGSTDPYLGLGVIEELKYKINFVFLDSLHTADHLFAELELVFPAVNQGSIIAIDDASYTNISYNFQYANIQRKKMGLPPVMEPESNKGECYYVRVEGLLRERFSQVDKLDDSYKQSYRDDIFFKYYQTDKKVMHAAGMEKLDELEHRFDAWRVATLLA
jgi:hypothetical protein